MAARRSRSKNPRKKRAAPKRIAKRGKSRAGKGASARGKKSAPKPYASLADLRRAIDRLDAILVPLLCHRLKLVCNAAAFKPSHSGVVVPSRVEEIIARVRTLAAGLGCNADTLEATYRAIIHEFTLEEQRRWQSLNVREA